MSNLKNVELNSNKYTIEELKYIIETYPVTLKTIIRTQILTPEFCKDYILRSDEKYCMNDSDTYITMDTVLYCQPHIKKEQLQF